MRAGVDVKLVDDSSEDEEAGRTTINTVENGKGRQRTPREPRWTKALRHTMANHVKLRHSGHRQVAVKVTYAISAAASF